MVLFWFWFLTVCYSQPCNMTSILTEVMFSPHNGFSEPCTAQTHSDLLNQNKAKLKINLHKVTLHLHFAVWMLCLAVSHLRGYSVLISFTRPLHVSRHHVQSSDEKNQPWHITLIVRLIVKALVRPTLISRVQNQKNSPLCQCEQYDSCSFTAWCRNTAAVMYKDVLTSIKTKGYGSD